MSWVKDGGHCLLVQLQEGDCGESGSHTVPVLPAPPLLSQLPVDASVNNTHTLDRGSSEPLRPSCGKGSPGRLGSSGLHTGSVSQHGSEISGNNNNNSCFLSFQNMAWPCTQHLTFTHSFLQKYQLSSPHVLGTVLSTFISYFIKS